MSNSNKELFVEGIKLIEQIEAHYYEAYFVGGCVRDHLLQVSITDIDIATSATPEQLKAIFPSLIPIGIDHGTVLIPIGGRSFEITTFRTDEIYAVEQRSTEVESVRSLKEDVNRRDFTMNALAMDRDMQLLDYCNGEKDIASALIRAVNDPLERMHEDPLRVMRGIRFVSQLGFTIDPSTKQAMKQAAHLLESVARERLYTECKQIFTHIYVKEALEQLLDIQADNYLPIFKEERTLIPALLNHIQPLASFSEVIALMHLHAPTHSVTDWVREWKCSNKIKQEAKILIRAYTNTINHGEINPFIIYMLRGHIEPFHRLCAMMHPGSNIKLQVLYELEKSLPIADQSELAVNGNDILDLFPHKKPGKWISEWLRKIEYMVVMNELPNHKKSVKEWILCNPLDTD